MAKPPGPVIGPAAVKAVEAAIDAAFDRAKNRVLGPWSVPKEIAIGYNREWSLPGIFEAAAREEGYVPDLKTLSQLLKIAGDYIDATRHTTKARAVKEITSFLQEAYSTGVKTDLPTVLGGKLQEVFADASVSMRRIIESEANQVKNVGILEGISRVNASLGIEDPIVYFVSVNDESRCSECERLHTIDGVIPRLWKLSQVGHGYHKKGDPNPKLGGLHPNCRCTMATLMPGYGFVGGRVTFVTRDHDEMAKQTGLGKSEPDYGEPLEKAFHWSDVEQQLARFGWTQKTERGSHTEYANPLSNIRGPTFSRGDVTRPMNANDLKYYVGQVGLGVEPGGQLFVKPDSGKTKSDYTAHYIKHGHYQDPAKAGIVSWTPTAAHTHVPIEQIDDPQGQIPWKVGKFHGLMGKPAEAAKIAPLTLQRQFDGRYQVTHGANRLGAAKLAGHTHVPAVVVP